MCRSGLPGLCSGLTGAVRGPQVGWRRRRHGPAKGTGAGESLGARSRIAARLRVDFPDDESMRVSHEAIYQSLYCARPRSAAPGAVRRQAVSSRRSAPRPGDVQRLIDRLMGNTHRLIIGEVNA